MDGTGKGGIRLPNKEWCHGHKNGKLWHGWLEYHNLAA